MEWDKLESTHIHQDEWLSLRADRCRLPNGKEIYPYYVIEEKDSVHIIPINEDGDVLVTEQYRHAAGVVCIEIPCGFIEDGESPTMSAERELLEETGARCQELVQVGEFYSNPARMTNKVYVFLAKNAKIEELQGLDETEDITFSFRPVDEIFNLIDSGKFSQGLHVASFTLALRSLTKK